MSGKIGFDADLLTMQSLISSLNIRVMKAAIVSGMTSDDKIVCSTIIADMNIIIVRLPRPIEIKGK